MVLDSVKSKADSGPTVGRTLARAPIGFLQLIGLGHNRLGERSERSFFRECLSGLALGKLIFKATMVTN